MGQDALSRTKIESIEDVFDIMRQASQKNKVPLHKVKCMRFYDENKKDIRVDLDYAQQSIQRYVRPEYQTMALARLPRSNQEENQVKLSVLCNHIVRYSQGDLGYLH